MKEVKMLMAFQEKPRKHPRATNLKRNTFRHFGSMAIPQSSKIRGVAN